MTYSGILFRLRAWRASSTSAPSSPDPSLARPVGPQHDQNLAILTGRAGEVLGDLADRPHGVLDAGGIDVQVLDRPGDLVDVLAGLLQHVLEPLAEAGDRVVQGATGLLLL